MSGGKNVDGQMTTQEVLPPLKPKREDTRPSNRGANAIKPKPDEDPLRLLNPQQVKFAEHFLVNYSYWEAYKYAGYEGESRAAANMVLNSTNMQRYLKFRYAEIQQENSYLRQKIINELVRMGFTNYSDFVKAVGEQDDEVMLSIGDLPTNRDKGAAVKEITIDHYVEGRGEDARQVKRVKLTLHDKHAALVTLGRHLGMFTDKFEFSGPGGGPIQTEQVNGSADNFRDISDDELAGKFREAISPPSADR